MMLLSRLNSALATLVRWGVDLLYIAPLRRWVGVEMVRYVVCGVLNYVVLDAILYYTIYHYVIGVEYHNIGFMVISPHVAALVLLFPITFLIGFWLGRYVTFESTQRRVRSQMFRYGLSVVGSILLSYVVLKYLVEGVGMWATPAKVLSSITTATYSYLMARFFTFSKGVVRGKNVQTEIEKKSV